MTKTYCDKCGKYVKEYHSISLPTEREGKKRPYVRLEIYEICKICINKLHEFIKGKE